MTTNMLPAGGNARFLQEIFSIALNGLIRPILESGLEP